MDAAREGLRRRAPGCGEESGAEARPERRTTPGLEWEPPLRSVADGREGVAASRFASGPTGVPSTGALSRSRAARSCDAISPRDASAPREGRQPPSWRADSRGGSRPSACDGREDIATKKVGHQSVAEVASEFSEVRSAEGRKRQPKTCGVAFCLFPDAPSLARTRVRALASRAPLALDAIAHHGGRELRGPARRRGDVGGRRDVRKRRPREVLAPSKRGYENRTNDVYRRGARRADDGRARRDRAGLGASPRLRRFRAPFQSPPSVGGDPPFFVGSTRVRRRDQKQHAVFLRGFARRARARRSESRP